MVFVTAWQLPVYKQAITVLFNFCEVRKYIYQANFVCLYRACLVVAKLRTFNVLSRKCV